MLECTPGQVNRVAVDTRWAIIGNGRNDALAVVGVGDLDLLTAKARLLARITVTLLVDGNDQVILAMDFAACAGNTILIIIG